MKDLSALTSRCIHCGLCLEACPTFVLTYDETQSPRGRIHLARQAMEGRIEWGSEVERAVDTCLGCRACETACPSGVRYGEILKFSRERLLEENPKRLTRFASNAFTNPAVLRTQLSLSRLWPGRKVPAFVSYPLAGKSAEANIPSAQAPFEWPVLEEATLPAVRGEVYMLEGCVMSVLFPRVNEATRRLLRRVGFTVRPAAEGCCGALHAHMGFLQEAAIKARDLGAAFPGELPIVVNAAGCGSTMKEFGVHEQALQSVASRVKDVSEFLFEHGLLEVLRRQARFEVAATYHDACHLAHGQGIRSQPRELLRAVPGLHLVELAEADMCCGSAGIYNLTQPRIARQLLDRKWANVEKSGASVVVAGNPGCHAWIEQAAQEHGRRVRVLHTVEALEFALSGVGG